MLAVAVFVGQIGVLGVLLRRRRHDVRTGSSY
jgi:hypothetical protein